MHHLFRVVDGERCPIIGPLVPEQDLSAVRQATMLFLDIGSDDRVYRRFGNGEQSQRGKYLCVG